MSYTIDLILCEELSREDFMDNVFDHTDLIQDCIDAHEENYRETDTSYKLFTEELDPNV